MQIILNGSERQVSADTTVASLVEELELSAVRLAVEINRNIVPRSRFVEHRLAEGDEVEIVRAIGGGQPRPGGV